MNEKKIITPEVVSDKNNPETAMLALPHQVLPDKLYLIPISGRPFFPSQLQPVIVDRNLWEETIKRVSGEDQKVLGLVYIDNLSDHPPIAEDFPKTGCVVQIHKILVEKETIQFIAQGLQRFQINHWVSNKSPYMAGVHYPQISDEENDRVKAYAMAIIKTIKELLPLNPMYNEELKNYLVHFTPNNPSPLSDFSATITSASGKELQEVMDTIPILRRMEIVLDLLHKEREIAKMQSEISQEVNRKISENQRKFFLREQLKVIQKELGISKDDKTADLEEFKARMKKFKASKQVIKRFDDEMDKLSILETGSPEYAVTRNYLEWITSIPWGVYSKDKLDIEKASRILEKDHDGLVDVKERIIEFLAVGAYKGEVAGSIMLLVGPPGVGKTSIGHSIAEALGRKFYRFSLGGMRDEAEIKGHRRTYIGALPGKFLQALKEATVFNPVIMLDEIDKIGASFRGDPASALLEALDPEQNNEFLDHYFDLRIDLSKVLFICTANQLDTIPGPLLDRMDAIHLSGYITDEKIDIARHHLWPKQLKKAGLKSKQLSITKPALKQLIDGYAREAGVRNMEKKLSRIVRKAVVKILKKTETKINISLKNLEDYLGPPIFRKTQSFTGIGIVTGLAWTSMGGVTLSIEAAKVKSEPPGLKLTGQLGNVMRESAEIAYSFLLSKLVAYGADPEFFKETLIHLHVPEGATPKDGPSAGVTMTSALLSLARDEKINRPLAMTGELTLTGRILPVGGIKEKVIAARRNRINELIIPDANKRDFLELPDNIREGITVHFAAHYNDVAKIIFDKKI